MDRRYFLRALLAAALTLPAAGQATRPRRAPREALLERWNRMTPEEREKALARLPPERRRLLERRLEEYRKLSPEQRRRFHRFNQLPPEKQQRARVLYRRFRQLPEERRRPLMREMRLLRDLTPHERRGRLDSESFRKRFSAEERGMLWDLSDVFDEVDSPEPAGP